MPDKTLADSEEQKGKAEVTALLYWAKGWAGSHPAGGPQLSQPVKAEEVTLQLGLAR